MGVAQHCFPSFIGRPRETEFLGLLMDADGEYSIAVATKTPTRTNTSRGDQNFYQWAHARLLGWHKPGSGADRQSGWPEWRLSGRLRGCGVAAAGCETSPKRVRHLTQNPCRPPRAPAIPTKSSHKSPCDVVDVYDVGASDRDVTPGQGSSKVTASLKAQLT